MKTKIIFEDNDLCVVHKPAGLATQTDKTGQMDVVSELRNYFAKKKQDIYVGIVHRLDQPVEGLLVFAKNKKTAAELTNQIADHTLNKHYYALVCGQPKEKEATLVDYLEKTNGNISKVVEKGSSDNAKEAKLHYTLCHTKGCEDVEVVIKNYSLVEVELFTGRYHQIRNQLSHYGFPILGDMKYGNEDSKALSSELGIRHVALLAYSIEFIHPQTKKHMAFSIPVPKKW